MWNINKLKIARFFGGYIIPGFGLFREDPLVDVVRRFDQIEIPDIKVKKSKTKPIISDTPDWSAISRLEHNQECDKNHYCSDSTDNSIDWSTIDNLPHNVGIR